MKPRLLAIELHHLGDAVVSLPFVRGAAGGFEVHVLCRPESAGVYRLLGNPPAIHEWTPPWDGESSAPPFECLRAAREKGRELAELGFSATACAWADPRTTLLAAETGASRRVGFPVNGANFYAPSAPGRKSRLLFGRCLEVFLPRLSHPLQSGPRSPHIERWSRMAGALGFECDFSVPWVPAPPPPKNAKPVLGVHRHARLPSKQWPMGKWGELLAMEPVRSKFEVVEILPSGASVPPGEKPILANIHTPGLPSLVSALAGCDAVLCHDSFPAHLAAALGKPVVAIFGSGEPDWFAPWNNRQRVVQKRICPLHPCIDRCGMPRHICLDEIQPADILRQLETLSPA